MANEVQFIYESTDSTLYFTLRNESGQMWNTGGTPNWESRTVANWDDYDIQMSETPASGYMYLGDLPAISGNMTARNLWADIYEQADTTGSPSISDDTLVGQMFGYWGGDIFRLGGQPGINIGDTYKWTNQDTSSYVRMKVEEDS